MVAITFTLATFLSAAALASSRSQITFNTQVEYPNHVPLPPLPWLAAANIVPSNSARYSLRQLQNAAIARYGDKAIFDCVDGQLTGVEIVGRGMGYKGTCPKAGIKWLPQEINGAAVADPPSGNITLSVLVAGTATGCLTEGGLWQNVPTCAAFNVTSYNVTGATEGGLAPTNNFTLTSIKGPCGAEKGSFTCSNKTTPSFFQGDLAANLLIFNLTSEFYSPMVPIIPFMKMPILTKPKAKFVNVTIKYDEVAETPAQSWIDMSQRD